MVRRRYHRRTARVPRLDAGTSAGTKRRRSAVITGEIDCRNCPGLREPDSGDHLWEQEVLGSNPGAPTSAAVHVHGCGGVGRQAARSWGRRVGRPGGDRRAAAAATVESAPRHGEDMVHRGFGDSDGRRRRARAGQAPRHGSPDGCFVIAVRYLFYAVGLVTVGVLACFTVAALTG